MKKKIIAMTLLALLVVSTAAYAKTSGKTNKAAVKVTAVSKSEKKDKTTGDQTSTQNKGQAKKQENKQKQQNKKTQKEQIKAKLATIKANLKAVETLKKQINAKKAQLNEILGQISDGTKTLPADKLQALNSQSSTLSASYKTITQGLASLYGQAEKKSKGRDLNTAVTALDSIIASIQDKSLKLTDLGTQYDAALAIANTAAAPTTTTGTTPADTDETTTPTPTTDTTSTDTTTPADTTTSVGQVVNP